MVTILFKKLNKEAVAPVRAHDGDAGWDVTATSIQLSHAGGNILVSYGIGLAFAIPKGMWMMAVPRSSVYKTGLWLSNGIGVIDSGYRGEVMAKYYSGDGVLMPYMAGDRIMQLIPMGALTDEVTFQEVDELPVSWDGRGNGGFGSSGK